jgi:hypothetical protein
LKYPGAKYFPEALGATLTTLDSAWESAYATQAGPKASIA